MRRKTSFGIGAPRWGVMLCLLAALATPAAPLMAQEAPAGDSAAATSQEPVLVVSIAGIDQVGGAVSYLAEAVGQPGTGGMFAAMAAGFTQGIDATRPLGITVQMIEGAPAPIAFVPAADISQFLKRIENQVGPAEKLEDGTYVIAAGANLLYIRQVGDWAYASQNREFLADVPDDPTTLLDGMADTYDLAVRLNVQAVPGPLRGMLVEQMKQGFNQAAARQAAEAQAMGQRTLEQLSQMISETERLQLGWSIDPASRRTFIDLEIVAVEGSELAEIYDGSQPVPSRFASVIRPDAALYYHAAASVSPKAVEQTRQSLDQTLQQVGEQLTKTGELSESQATEVEALIKRLAELGMDTVAEGKIDLGVLVTAGSETLTASGGALLADGNELAALLKDVAAKVEEEPGAPRFLFDQGEFNGVTMHTVEADVPESEEEARQVFGPVLQVKLGTADDAVYFAMGEDAEARMKALIVEAEEPDASDRPLGQAYFSLLPVLQFAQSVDQQEVIAAMIDAIARSGETDRVNLISNSISRGQRVRISIGEGILRAIGAGIQADQMKQQGGNF